MRIGPSSIFLDIKCTVFPTFSSLYIAHSTHVQPLKLGKSPGWEFTTPILGALKMFAFSILGVVALISKSILESSTNCAVAVDV